MRSLALLAVLIVLPACKTSPEPGEDAPDPVSEDQFASTAAETLCAQLFACQCADDPSLTLLWPDEAACVAEKQVEFQTLLDGATSLGGEYSPECGGQYIANFTRPDCLTAWDYAAEGGKNFSSQLCPLTSHARAVGDPCEPFIGLSNDCGEGKLCSFDTYTCVEVGSLPVALGGVCQVDSFQLPCTDGLLCLSNEDGSRTCQAPAKLGDPCPDYSCPGADLNCNFDTFICESNAGVGESCLGVSCAEGLYCDGGQDSTCVAQYGPGEGCASSVVCAENGQCINNFCQEPAPLVCYYG